MPIKRKVDKHVRIHERQDELLKEYCAEYEVGESAAVRQALDLFFRGVWPERFVKKPDKKPDK